MAKKRLIPKLLLSASKFNSQKLVVVITKQFNERIEIGDPVSQAKIFQDQSADELVFINIEVFRKTSLRYFAKYFNIWDKESIINFF